MNRPGPYWKAWLRLGLVVALGPVVMVLYLCAFCLLGLAEALSAPDRRGRRVQAELKTFGQMLGEVPAHWATAIASEWAWVRHR